MLPGGTVISATQTTPPALAAGFAADWITPKSEVASWLASAKPGARLLYGQGERLIRGETATFLREAHGAGKVDLFQPRSALPGRFDFIAVKKDVVKEACAGGRTADPAKRVIFKRLVRAAERGEPCPPDKQLADLAGLSSHAKAQWRVRKLEREGLIKCRLEHGPGGERFRVVTIVGNGLETAGPRA